MSQNPIIISGVTGAQFRQDVIDAFESVSSGFYGATDPSTIPGIMELIQPGFGWADSGNDLFKRRNAANDGWNTIYKLSTGRVIDSNAWLGLQGPVVPGNTILLESLSEKTSNVYLVTGGNVTSGEVVKKFRVARAGRYRVTGEIANTAASYKTVVGVSTDGCIGSIVSSENTGSTYAPFQLDMPVMAIPGNIIEVRIISSNSSGVAKIKNVRVRYDEPSVGHGYTNEVVLA